MPRGSTVNPKGSAAAAERRLASSAAGVRAARLGAVPTFVRGSWPRASRRAPVLRPRVSAGGRTGQRPWRLPALLYSRSVGDRDRFSGGKTGAIRSAHESAPEGLSFIPLARAYLDRGEAEKAEVVCREALETRPNNALAWGLLGRALI